MDAANNKISYLISSQLPEFVRRDHPKFIEFLEAYYKWMEQDGEALYAAKRFGDFYDIDVLNSDLQEDIAKGHTNEEELYHNLLLQFQKMYAAGTPLNLQADQVIVMKHLKDFFRATGTEKSYRFGTRAIFNKDPSFYYPQNNILKASDGKWFVEKSLNIRDIAVDGVANVDAFPRFANTTIRGSISNSTCVVESVNPYYDAGVLITEIKVSSVTKDFTNGETLSTTIEDEGIFKTLTANLYSGIITKVTVSEAGSGYTQGAAVPVVPTPNGSGGQVIISKVAKSKLEGKIKAVKVVLPGAGYQANTPLLFTGGGGSGAVANVNIVDTSETYHPANYSIIGSRIIDVYDLPIQNAVGDLVETQAYTNLATISVNTSNLGLSTIPGSIITDVTLSSNMANSNVYFETGDVLFVQNTYQTIVSSNKYYWEMTIKPGLPGNLSNVSFTVFKKPNVNSIVADSMNYWSYASCGPIVATAIINPGSGYIELPSVSVLSNTFIRSLGILGRMEINDGGVGYVAGDVINFVNPYGTYGTGANAQVSIVDANGSITEINWFAQPGHLPGGSGYRQDMLPTAVVISQNTDAYGANITVTACLADGASLEAQSNVIGSIKELKVISGGYGYETPPIIDLSQQGDGLAQAFANVVTGIYTYPGRYLNQDGQPSSYIFLEDRDYYQKFSYVIRISESLDAYRSTLVNLIHPAGLKLFGEHLFEDKNETAQNPVVVSNTIVVISNTSSNTTYVI